MSSSRAGRVLCLGRLYCDLVFTGLEGMPVLGRERFAEHVAIVPGGGAFITAAHLARLGRPAGLLTRLGLDPLSQGLVPAITAAGLTLDFVEQAAEAGPQLTVAMVAEGDRAFLSRRASHARPATLEAALSAPDARHLHLAEYATLHELPDVALQAAARGLTVSLDPSWDETLIRDPGLLDAAAGCDLFFPNEDEALAITGADSPLSALDMLAQRLPCVVLKRGGEGAVLARGPVRISVPAPQVAVVDTTGAGDAFNAGFLDAWLAGADDGACLLAGVEAGSRAVQKAGGA